MSAATQRVGRPTPIALILFALGMAAGLVACASETTPDDGSGGSGAGGGANGGGETGGGNVGATCAEIADIICERAEACAGDGSATVKINDLTNFVYESRAYCTTIFTDQCGPSVPASYNPRVPDPAACGAALISSACDGKAYPVPGACGGS